MMAFIAMAVAQPAGAEQPLEFNSIRTLWDEGKNEAAETAINEMFEMYPDLQNNTHPQSAEAWHLHAYIRYSLDDLATAIASLRKARAAAQAFPGGEPLSGIEYELGFLLLFEARDAAAAIEPYTAALESLQGEGNDPQTHATWQSELAEAYRVTGNYEQSEYHLEAALASSTDSGGESFVHAVLLNNLGALYWDQGRLAEAERKYRDALALSERLLELSREDEDAVQNLSRRLTTAHQNLGVILYHQQRPRLARIELERAKELADLHLDAVDPLRIYSYGALAKVLSELSELERAEELWNEALTNATADNQETFVQRAEILHERALARIEHDEHDLAAQDLREAIRVWESALGTDHPMVGRLQSTLARASVPKGDAQQLVQLCDQAVLRLQDNRFAPDALAEALALRGQARDELGQRDAAIADTERALRLVEQLRGERGTSDATRLAFMRRFASRAEALVGWLVDRNQAGRAVATAERLRARLLQDELRADRVDLRRGIDPEILRPLERREKDARAKIADRQRELRQTRVAHDSESGQVAMAALKDALLELERVEDELRLQSPVWSKALRGQSDDDIVERVQRSLGDAAALYYFLGRHRSLVFYVPPAPAAVEAFTLAAATNALPALVADESQMARTMENPNLESLTRGVTGMRPAGEGARLDSVSGALARQLYEVFGWLMPAELWTKLQQHPQVVVVPDGPLHAMPFEALVTKAPANGDVQYWLDAGPTLRYAHSFGVWQALRERPSRRKAEVSVVSISNPAFDTDDDASPFGRALKPLPGTAVESAAVTAAFGADAVVVLSGAAATERASCELLPRAKYVHLATHGVIDRDSGGRLSALAFAPSGSDTDLGDDGMLQLFEIYDLDLACDLAVLSACETKAGTNLEGEGVYAISRGFHVAGSRQTVASLWAVNDDSTAELMGNLFRGLASNEDPNESRSVAELLRTAKQSIRQQKKWSHPAYWAPFVLSGSDQLPATKD